jgi:branched-chain amino acid transport system permease protein
MVLLATFIGGAGYFFGPILGAVLVSYLQTMLSDITDVWQLYFGLLFIATVMFAPGGIAHLIMMHRPLWRAGTIWRLVPAYVMGLIVLLTLLAGIVLSIEMIAHFAIKAAEGPTITLCGLTFDTGSLRSWRAAIGLIAVGASGIRLVAAPVSSAWDRARKSALARGAAA